MPDPSLEETPIPGLLLVRLDVRPDARGWFKENWQRAKLTALGLPDFGPVQQNVSFNARRGVTRGFHAEPWDKLVSLTSGRAYGVWVDLREGDGFGRTFTRELDPSLAVYVPRGVGNGFQALEDATTYTYLVNDHWRPDVRYPAVALDDPRLGVAWPVPLAEAELSDKDRTNPLLSEVAPVAPRRTLVLGADGQVGRALREAFPGCDATSRTAAPADGVRALDLTDPDALTAWPWHDYDLVLNAAAYTAVDSAETGEGRVAAWAVNAAGPAALARLAAEHRFTLVHVSSDYVFDGTRGPHREDEPLSPLGVYGQSKAAGDLAVASAPRHYVLRASWVVGDGGNFVRTMARLARDGASPGVVGDQVGRLTFASEVARAAAHLVGTHAPYGTYHVSNGGDPMSWHDVAVAVFESLGRPGSDVRRVSTEEYAAGRQLAPRPRDSVLDLAKLESTGWQPADAVTALRDYCAELRP